MYKTQHGGCWHTDRRFCRSAARSEFNPGSAHKDIGFRVVCEEKTTDKVTRGGSWITYNSDCTSAARPHGNANDALSIIGFRVVCEEEKGERRE